MATPFKSITDPSTTKMLFKPLRANDEFSAKVQLRTVTTRLPNRIPVANTQVVSAISPRGTVTSVDAGPSTAPTVRSFRARSPVIEPKTKTDWN